MDQSFLQLFNELSLEETPNKDIFIARKIMYILPLVEMNRRMPELVRYMHEIATLSTLPEPERIPAVVKKIEEMVDAFRVEFNSISPPEKS